MSEYSIDTTWLLQRAIEARRGAYFCIVSPPEQGRLLAAAVRKVRPDLIVEVEEAPRERARVQSNGSVL